MSSEVWNAVSDSAKDLLHKMLVVDVYSRITADDALKHPWIQVTSMCVCVCVCVSLRTLKVITGRPQVCGVESPGGRILARSQRLSLPCDADCDRSFLPPSVLFSAPACLSSVFNTIQYNTIQYKTFNKPYVTKMLFVGAGMTRD